jgi:hypothetical protein
MASKPNITKAARELNLPYQTLRRRFLGLARPKAEAHQNQMLLSPTQEKTVVDWILYLAATGHPVDKRAIRAIVKDVCSKRPSGMWIKLFRRRHPEVKLGKARGLDPRRAQAFNRPVVSRYFAQLQRLIEEYNIPEENIYNMDEKGVQRGGGKKGNNRKYFVGRNARTNYKAASANLELVTIIECVSVNGALEPGFVFSGQEFCPEWFDTPGITYAPPLTRSILLLTILEVSLHPQMAGRTTNLILTGWKRTLSHSLPSATSQLGGDYSSTMGMARTTPWRSSNLHGSTKLSCSASLRTLPTNSSPWMLGSSGHFNQPGLTAAMRW